MSADQSRTLKEDEARREEARKAEEDRIAAEKEFLEKHEKERRLSSSRGSASALGGGYRSGTSSMAESESEAEKQKKRNRSPEEKEKEKRRKARKTEDLESDEEEKVEDEDDPLVCLSLVMDKMKGWFKQPTIMKMVTKPQTEKFGRYLNRFQEELIRAREDRVRIETRLEERREFLKIVSSTVRHEMDNLKDKVVPGAAGVSYSAVLKKDTPMVPRVTGMKGPVVQAPKQIIVRHDTLETEEVTKTLKKLVRPSEIGLKVKRLINIKNGVIIEAENEDGVQNLMKQETLKEAGLKVERPEKKKPFIMIYDVSAKLTEDEVKEEIFSRNMGESQIVEADFKQEFAVRHRYKDLRSTGKRCHVVVECSVRVKNWLRRKERIFVEWQSCRVKDYVDVARCFKCQKFGHVAKHCKSETPACSHCAGEHDYKDCPNKGKKEKVRCINCVRDKKENSKHEARSRKCPAYEKAVRRQNEKIDYGLYNWAMESRER
ncbi:golgin subfamily A member 6-like protein 22 [Macrosteles quadrilineatus]|uniref:golgin subfamily A member 6-like protein 22 n=1 Tax=Macrosteles quadrilineatus TaxID=74068 RepID=UPI0023E272A7|nr:golgin subfamily A member 6-like protein 22 [Macrosteles quadrilineatus]